MSLSQLSSTVCLAALMSDELRNIMALPPRYGELGIPVMMDMADREYKFSCKATKPLKEAILKQVDNYTEDWRHSKGVKTDITTERNLFYRKKKQKYARSSSQHHWQS